MGEIAEMMLDGTLCVQCGSYIEHSDPDGVPRYCSPQCRRDSGIDEPRTNRVACPICQKVFRSREARRRHQRDKHASVADRPGVQSDPL